MDVPAEPAVSSWDRLRIPANWPDQGDVLAWCEFIGPSASIALMVAGMIYLLFGIHVFRVLVMVNAAIVGICLGAVVGQGYDAVLVSMGVFGFTFAAIAWPMSKVGVALTGGALGALLGVSVWRLAGLDPAFAWAGGVMGLIACSLIAFVLFRGSVMIYTSAQGAMMLIFGMLGFLQQYPRVAAGVAESFAEQPILLPAAIFMPTLLGLLYQQSQHAAEEKKKKKQPARAASE